MNKKTIVLAMSFFIASSYVLYVAPAISAETVVIQDNNTATHEVTHDNGHIIKEKIDFHEPIEVRGDFKEPIEVRGDFKEPKEAVEPKEPKGFDD